MSKPIVIQLDGHILYQAEELYNYDSVYFYGCSRIRTIIDKKRLTEDDYIFGYVKDGEWIISNKNYQKAKLLIKENWVNNNVPKFKEEINNNDYQYDEAPEILELTNEEKFKDVNGNSLEIEVRGERKHNNCYFKVIDISKSFDMPNLQKVLNNKDNEYKINIHYKNFIVNQVTNDDDRSSKKYLYLTYNGVLKVLFSSRSGNAESFQNWASEKLFTVHLGESDDKEQLASNLLGVNHKTIKDVFKNNSSKTPC